MTDAMQNSLLTAAQREYLRGESDPGDGRRMYDKRIRDRLVPGVEDLLLLRNEYPREEMEKVAKLIEPEEAFKAAAFLDVLGEMSRNRRRTHDDRVDELEERLDDLENNVDRLTGAFQSVGETID